jgi:hypothetical protein
VVLQWDGRTGEYSRRTEREDPALRSQVIALLEEDTFEDLDRAMLSILQRVP